MRTRESSNQLGFTLVELMLAMSIFVTVMVISTAGFIGMNRTFTRGTIRKQLSESVQRTTEDIARATRSMPQKSGKLQLCKVSDKDIEAPAGCPAKPWNALCLTGSRYYWNPSKGAMYKDIKGCDEIIDTSSAEQFLDERYKVAKLEVSTVGGLSLHLYNISGVFRTTDDEAFSQIENPDLVKCRGSAESSAVRSCALERFSFTINARGSTLE